MAKKGGKLRAVYGVFFALLTLFVGGLFIMQVWSIYRSAPQSPYTVKNISKHFKEIALPVWAWLGGLAVSVLLALIFPEEKARVKAKADGKKTLEKVKAKVPTEGEHFDKACALNKRSKAFRVCVGVITALFVLAATALCVLTLWDIYYHPIIEKPFFQKQKGMVDKIVQVAALSIGALILCCIAVGLFAISRKREQKGYLAIIAESKRPPVEEPVKVEPAPQVAEETEEPVRPCAEEVAPPCVEEVTPPLTQAMEAPAVAVEEAAKPSRWAAVLRKIVGKLFLGEDIPQEEIDGDIQKILDPTPPTEEKSEAPQVAKEEAAKAEVREEATEKPLPPVEKPIKAKKEKKAKKKKPLVKEKKVKKAHPKARKAGLVLVRVGLATAGILLVALGVYNGGMKDVLLKAINICTQCIGLG